MGFHQNNLNFDFLEELFFKDINSDLLRAVVVGETVEINCVTDSLSAELKLIKRDQNNNSEKVLQVFIRKSFSANKYGEVFY